MTENFVAFKKDAEICKWGPIPGRFFYVSEFEDAVFKEFSRAFDGDRWPNTLFLFNNKKMVWINDFQELRDAGKKLFLKYMLDSASRKTLREQWIIEIKKLSDFEEKINADLLQRLNNEELYDLFNKFLKLIVSFFIPTIPAELGNYGSDSLLFESLKSHIKNDAELLAAMEVLTAPEVSSFYQEEEIDLAKTNDLKNHLNKYFWLKNSYNGAIKLSEEFFTKRKNELNGNIEELIIKKLEETKNKKANIISKYKLSEEIENISKALCDGVAWQDERKKHIFIYTHYKEMFLEEISKRFNLPIESLKNCGTKEILEAIKNGDLEMLLKKREDFFGFFANPEIRELSDDEVDFCWSTYVDITVDKDINEFTGIVASTGKEGIVEGTVTIVSDPNESKSFKKGDILVASMTSPEFVFLMKKAKAIITDSGGLTSHAAIVSRELNIPCIVNTKFATKILKDGDLVEINSELGIVKIIKKAK